MGNPQFDTDMNVSAAQVAAGKENAYLTRATTAFLVAAAIFLTWTVVSLGKFASMLGANVSGWSLLGTLMPLIGVAAILILSFYGASQIRSYYKALRAQSVSGDVVEQRFERTAPEVVVVPSDTMVRTETATPAEVAVHTETADAA